MIKQHSIKYLVEETNINFYAWQLIIDGQTRLYRYFGPTTVDIVTKIKDDMGLCGFSLATMSDLGKRLMTKLEQGTLDPQTVRQDHLKPGARISALCYRIMKTDLTKVSRTQIGQWFKVLWDDYLDLCAAGWIPVLSDYEHNLLSNRLIGILRQHKVKEKEVQNYMSLLVSLNQPTLYWQEELDMLTIAKKYKSLAKVLASKEYQRHQQKYFWLNYGYQGPTWTADDFLTKVKKIFANETPVAKQWSEHASRNKRLGVQQKSLIKQLKLSKAEQHLFAVAREFMYLKAYRIEVRHLFDYVSDLLFKEMSGRTGFPLTVFRYALREEILAMLRGTKVNVQKIIDRRQGMVHARDGKRVFFVPQNKVKAFLSRVLVPEKIERSDIITGQAAYIGKVRGQVKIVKAIADIPKVQHGDILVAPATTPDVLPAMYKALAFVTDTGGITSHAAIVAREMKKPCVIGTKIATKVLKDGDLVEVDAAKGTVTLLK